MRGAVSPGFAVNGRQEAVADVAVDPRFDSSARFDSAKKGGSLPCQRLDERDESRT